MAMARPTPTFSTASSTLWYLKSSTGTWTGTYVGPGSYVAASDFDGDGKTDPAIFNSEVIWYFKSTTGAMDGIWMGSGTYQIVN